MKKFLALLSLILISSLLHLLSAQNRVMDSLKTELQNARHDSTRLRIYLELGDAGERKDNLLYAEPALLLADKLLSETKDDSARKKIQEQKVGAYSLMLAYYTDDRYADTKKADDLGEKIIDVFREQKDTAEIINAYRSLCWYYLSLGNFPKGLEAIQKAISVSKEMNYPKGTGICYGQLGDIYRDQGENTEALKNYEIGLGILTATKDTDALINVIAAMGGFYYKMHDMEKSLECYRKVIALYEAQKMNDHIAYVYGWIGDAYKENNDYDKALLNYQKSLALFDSINNKEKKMFMLDRIGSVYFLQNSILKAISYHNQSLTIATEIKDQIGIASGSLHLAHDYNKQKNYSKAKEYCNRSIDALNIQFDIQQMAEAELLASQIDSAIGDGMSAYSHYKKYSLLNEKLKADEIHKAAQREKFQNDFDQQKAIAKAEQEKKDIQQRNIRNSIGVGLAGSLIFLIVVYRQRNKISKEKKRSDELLLNILPAETAEELKATGAAEAKSFDEVTVMFTDFKNFTQASEKMNAKELVSEMNYLFSEFDTIISKHNIEKIKTIGDSYMCAGGLPVANKTNASDVVSAGLEIQQFMSQLKEEREKENKYSFEIRIGIHTGPVVAGIVGIKKFAYDIWGDTVNLASRMESSGEPGKVNISGSTYELVKDKFTCTYRGKIEAKNKGMIDMYFVNHSFSEG